MKKTISLILVLLLIAAGVAAASGAGLLDRNEKVHSHTIELESNATTGFMWNAFILGGDSVVIDEEASVYVPNENKDNAVGVGGKQLFVVNAVKPGETIIRLTYARSSGEIAGEQVMVVMVDEKLNITVNDVTEAGVYDGVVTEVNEAEHCVTLDTERAGEIIARFDENEALPAQDEHIMLYTNGTMTMSLPAIVNAMAWSSIPGEMARG